VSQLQPVDSKEQPKFYVFRVQCTSCWEVHDKAIGMSRWDKVALPRSRGEANFVWRCKQCKRDSSASIVTQTIVPYAGEGEHGLLSIDCRGLQLLEFFPEVRQWMREWLMDQDGWACFGESTQTPFSVDLSDGEWFDYDEKAAAEVSISELKWSIRRQ